MLPLVRLVMSIASPSTLDGFSGSPQQQLPPYASATLRLVLPSAPAPNELLSIACAVLPPVVSVTLSSAADKASPFTFLQSSATALSFEGVAASLWSGGIDLPLTVSALLPLDSKPGAPVRAELSCALTSKSGVSGAGSDARMYPRYPPASTTMLPIVILPTSLPLSFDALLELPTTNGAFKSSWGAGVSDLPPWLLGFNVTSGAAAPFASPWTNASLVLASPAALAALTAVAIAPPLASSTPPSPPWALTLSGSAHLVLVATAPAPPFSTGSAFRNTTAVSLGGVPAVVNWVSPDGSLMSIVTPSFSSMCGSDAVSTSSGVCGLRSLVVGDSVADAAKVNLAVSIATSPSDAALSEVLSTTQDGDIELHPTVVCPPACPADWRGKLSSVSNGAMLTTALALQSSSQTSASALDTGAGGVYLVTACAGYAPPSTGVCSNASSPLAATCAWGVGDSCQPCPRGALCPGGARLWPRAGFWASSQDAQPSELLPCPAPDAATRCPGAVSAGTAAGAFPCGEGYRTGTVGCAGCDDDFFPSAGACTPCARNSVLNGVVLPVAFLVAGALGVCVAFTLLTFTLVRKRGGTLRGSFTHTVQLVVWLWVALQVLVQVARSTQANAPPALASFFSALTALQFQGLSLDPSCVTMPMFATTWAQFIFVAVCMGFIAAHAIYSAVATFTRCDRGWCREREDSGTPSRSSTCAVQLRHSLVFLAAISVKLLAVLYALLTNTALSALTCTAAPLTVRGYLVLAQDGSALLTAARAGAFGDDAGAAVLAPGGYAALAAYNAGTAPSSSLSPPLAAAAPSLLSAPLLVSVLASNTFIVCHEGAHVRVEACAWVVFVLFCLAFPLACFAWALLTIDARMNDSAIVGELRATQWRVARGAWYTRARRIITLDGQCFRHRASEEPSPCTNDLPPVSSPAGATFVASGGSGAHGVINPLFSALSAQRSAQFGETSILNEGTCGKMDSISSTTTPQLPPPPPTATAAHSLVDATPVATEPLLLRAITAGDTRPSYFIFALINQAVLLVLAVPVAYNTQAAGLGGRPLSLLLVSHAGALAASLLATLAAAYAIVRIAPYPREFQWKAHAKVRTARGV